MRKRTSIFPSLLMAITVLTGQIAVAQSGLTPKQVRRPRRDFSTQTG
jgi:hypothetical protein